MDDMTTSWKDTDMDDTSRHATLVAEVTDSAQADSVTGNETKPEAAEVTDSAQADSVTGSYVSDEMKQILADIKAQDALIEEARAAKKSLRAAKRRQARLDKAEGERRAREAEQREAVALWRLLHESNITIGDGTVMNGYEFVADEVLTRLFKAEPQDASVGTTVAPTDAD